MNVRISLAIGILLTTSLSLFAESTDSIDDAIRLAGDNADQINRALADVPKDQLSGMQFLVQHMPEHDLKSLSAEFLLENVDYAYKAWHESPWKDQISEDIFFNDVLPYANINERRDRWRKEFYERFKPIIKDIAEPGAAAVKLNQTIFPTLNVKYSTKRRRADQGPKESIESGLASCTGLSILLIDACRSVGVPARFVGTPLWSDKSGNHSWVEVYDKGWHFTGAAEPAGDDLDRAWFVDRASKADRAERLHAIYAVSYRHTPQEFPMVWARRLNFVHAVNVTDRYTALKEKLADDAIRVRFRVFGTDGNRCSANFCIKDNNDQEVFSGTTNDERFDANDHITTALKKGEEYSIEVEHDGKADKQTFKASSEGQLETVRLNK
ncbi:MAG: transglutaminase domain-containing protein [Planctomycetales bacterium]|nr:transglutaminase domain-containing protein [Planctomycetales bacterium]